MDYTEQTAKLVDVTYRNILEEFAPCTKQLVIAGKAYLKSLQGVIGTSKQYIDALSKVAQLANNSTLKGSGDIGTALDHIVDVNRELMAQQANIMKCLEFDFLEPIEIAADKDTKLIGKEQKRFQQMYKGRRENYIKCVSTLKKSKRKKNIDPDKQLRNMTSMEDAKNRLDDFCHDSLKEAVTDERSLYGTVLERQCVLSRQLLQYHAKGCDLLRSHIPDWEELAASRKEIPDSCYSPPSNKDFQYGQADMDESFYQDPSANGSLRSSPNTQKGLRRESDLSSPPWKENFSAEDGVYARPMVRAKSEFQLPTSPSSSTSGSDTPPTRRFSRMVEYNGEATKANHVCALYSYNANGSHEMSLEEGDLIEFKGPRNKAGWQFGENLTSRTSGWFPVSYTETVTDGIRPAAVNTVSKSGSPRDLRMDDVPKRKIPIPPPPPATVSSLRSKYGTHQQQATEASEYGMPSKHISRKPLPVEPPTVSLMQSSTNNVRDAQARQLRHHGSQPDLAGSSSFDSPNRKSNNGRK